VINVETKIEKLAIPEETMLVEVVSQDNGDNHMVYYLAEDGSIIDFVHVVNTRISDVIAAIPHMMVINFTEMKFWKMAMETMMYNRIFEIDLVRYDDFDCWAMDETMVQLFRHWCKIINVANYKETDEYMAEVHIVDDYIYSKQAPVEYTHPDVYFKAVVARKRQVEIIKEWAL
jgi:hypothetical protein